MDPILSAFGNLIFLDRYAKKNQDRSQLVVGQQVIVCLDTKKTQRELAIVAVIDTVKRQVTVKVAGQATTVDVPIDQIDLPIEDTIQARKRVAAAVAMAEHENVRGSWTEMFWQHLLSDWSFVPGGRVLAGAGVDEQLTSYNCFCLPAPKDSRNGIIHTLDRMTEIMSRGGGVGIPLMSLRPKYGHVKGVNGRSSGSVAWGEIYSFGTGLIEQGGSRRGALLLLQYDWHPDILEFINAKRDFTRIKNANISIAISDAFMAAVKADEDWQLVFPDTTHPAYDAEWDGDLPAWKAKGYAVKIHATIKARKLWNAIAEASHASAEPGVLFIERYNAMSNSYYYPRGKIYVCNPCAEEGVPSWAVCNLGHVNLARHVIGDGLVVHASVDWEKLKQTVSTAIRFMDDIIDVAYAPFAENIEQQKNERRIGLGTMGLGELLIRCHVRYGANPECLAFLDKLYGFIATTTYEASAKIAQEKGSFGWYDKDKFLTSGFMKKMPEAVRSMIAEHGLRNVTLLTQAPTGCVAPETLISVDGALKPIVTLGDPEGDSWQALNVNVATDHEIKATSHFYVNGHQPVRTVTTKCGFSITATPQHQLRMITSEGTYVWRRIDEMQEGDVLCLKRNTLGSCSPAKLESVESGNLARATLPSEMTPELAELLGYYMGDGYLKDRGGVHLVVCDKDPDLSDYLIKLLKGVWGDVDVAVESRLGCSMLNMSGYHVTRFLNRNGMAKPKGNYGEGAAGAFIPDAVLASGVRCVAAFLRGLFEADGCVSVKQHVTLASVSKRLIDQAQVALLGIGIVSTVRTITKEQRASSFGDRTMYELRLLNRREVNIFAERVGFIGERKRNRLAAIPNDCARGDTVTVEALRSEFYEGSKGLSNTTRQTILQRTSNGSLNVEFVRQMLSEHPQLTTTSLGKLVTMDLFFDEIVAVDDEESDTFDISVPETNTYIANGFVSHNTVGSMIGTSTGIEPYPWWKWERKSRLGVHNEQANVYGEYLKAFPKVAAQREALDPHAQAVTSTGLPSWFVTAAEMAPEDHAETQGAIQRWVDASISKTSSVPTDYTVEQVGKYYEMLYDLGCKGGTIYRDRSRDEQVLNIPEASATPVVEAVLTALVKDVPRYELRPVPTNPYNLKGVPVPTPSGKISVKIGLDADEPFEVWVEASKPGTAVSADTQAIARLSSLILRMNSPIPSMRRLDLIADQLEGIRGGDPVGYGPKQVVSLPDGVAHGLRRLKKSIEEDRKTRERKTEKPEKIEVVETAAGVATPAGSNGKSSNDKRPAPVTPPLPRRHGQTTDICPSCHQVGLTRTEGCVKCFCGYSKCG